MIKLDWLPLSIKFIWDLGLIYGLPERYAFSAAVLLKFDATFVGKRIKSRMFLREMNIYKLDEMIDFILPLFGAVCSR